jgi:hypothetical protein
VLSRRDYERQFGTKYRRPGILARVLAFVLKIVPKIGPLRPLAFEPLTAEAERLFLESVTTARTRYRTALQALRERRLNLRNTDFDTDRLPLPGRNRLADETYADLLHELAGRGFVGVSPELRKHLNDFFAGIGTNDAAYSRKVRSRIRRELAVLNRP